MHFARGITIAISITLSGCGVMVDLTRKTADGVQYSETADELMVSARNHFLAKSAWNEFRDGNSDAEWSRHFERGFRQGFADYLDGGSGEPPVIPPRTYWKVFYQTPEGHQDVQDWFAGYRMGAIAAEQSGRRQWLTIPTALEDAEGSPESWEPERVTRATRPRNRAPAAAPLPVPDVPNARFAASLMASDDSSIVPAAYSVNKPQGTAGAGTRQTADEPPRSGGTTTKQTGLLILPVPGPPGDQEP